MFLYDYAPRKKTVRHERLRRTCRRSVSFASKENTVARHAAREKDVRVACVGLVAKGRRVACPVVGVAQESIDKVLA